MSSILPRYAENGEKRMMITSGSSIFEKCNRCKRKYKQLIETGHIQILLTARSVNLKTNESTRDQISKGAILALLLTLHAMCAHIAAHNNA